MSTFGSFGTVRLGIYAAQKGLDVTGNNITNINTRGYTRQRLDQVSLVAGASDKYRSPQTRIGQGVLISGVSQIRDPGLDLAYRGSQANLGAADAKLAGLQDLASILDEVGKGSNGQDDGVILDQLNDLRDLINQAITNGGKEYDSLVRASAQSLCTLFNKYADELSDLKDRYETYLNQDINKINDLLSGIQELNETIRNSEVRGDPALELRDQRNVMLDELSQFMKIDVKYTMEDAGNGLMVEKMTVSLATGDKNTLIDGVYATKLSTDMDNPNYPITIDSLRDPDGELKIPATLVTELGDTDLYGSLQSIREMLTEEGEFSSTADQANDPNAAVKRGIPYYQKMLDNLAFEFAEQMNALNQTPAGQDPIPGAGNLFSNSATGNDATGITAANISVSKDWADGNIHMLSSRKPNAGSGDTSNLAAFLDLFSKKQSFDPKDIQGDATGAVYEGSFEDMLLKIQSTLAEDEMTTTKTMQNHMITTNEIYMQRESVSGVDLNDEAANLMVYQKAYTAACRLLTVLDEALNSLLAI